MMHFKIIAVFVLFFITPLAFAQVPSNPSNNFSNQLKQKIFNPKNKADYKVLRGLECVLDPSQKIPMEKLSASMISSYLHKYKYLSLDEFLPCLPDYNEWDAYTLVHTSMSPESHDISYETPRVLLVGKEGKLTLSYTGNVKGEKEEDSDYNVLRVMEYSSDSQTFNLHKISIGKKFESGTGASKAYYKSQKNAAECYTCHSSSDKKSLKPIWGGYRRWTNAYGSGSDGAWVDDDEDQYHAYKNFLKNNLSGTRYTPLVKEMVKKLNLSDLNSSSFNQESPDTLDNNFITDKYLDLNGSVVSKKLSQSSLINQYKYKLAATFLGCEIPKLYTQFESEFSNKTDYKIYYQAYQNYKNELESLDEVDYVFGRYHDFRRTTMLLIYSKLLGVNPEYWDIPTFPQNIDYENDFYYRGPNTNDGVKNQDFYVFKSFIPLFNNLPALVKSFNKIINESTIYYEPGIPLNMEVRLTTGYGPYPQYFDEQCDLLEPYL